MRRTTIPGVMASKAIMTAGCASRSLFSGQPGFAGSSSGYAGLLFDLFPTFLELAKAEKPEDLDAISLGPILRGGALDAKRHLYFVRREGGLRYGGKSYEAIIRDDWKLLQNDPYSRLELYNLREDPQEQKNLADQNLPAFRELADALRRHIQRGGTVPWQPPGP
jgi:arylsulfatase A-like enzyme